MAAGIEYLFVYGTLLPELAPSGLREVMQELRRIGPGSMPGRLYDLGPYPGAVSDEAAAACVVGQVFELPAEQTWLQRLDDYEGFLPEQAGRSLFIRVQRPVRAADGSQRMCWVYLCNRDLSTARPIPGGDYSAWLADRSSPKTTTG